jgi:hypothetical protein
MPLKQLVNYKKKVYKITKTPLIVTLRKIKFKGDLKILPCKKLKCLKSPSSLSSINLGFKGMLVILLCILKVKRFRCPCGICNDNLIL